MLRPTPPRPAPTPVNSTTTEILQTRPASSEGLRRFPSCFNFARIAHPQNHHSMDAMTKAEVLKLRPADLRRIAAKTREAERERKMLALAEQLEEKEHNERGPEDDTRELTKGKRQRYPRH